MRLLVIGLDGATFDQLSPWIEAGYMPTLERLIREGTSARLRSTIPPITAPAWSTFATGLNPGRHGIFGFLRPVEGRGRERVLNDSRDVRGIRFWTVLNHTGQRVGIVDLPMFYPPEAINDFMVSDTIASGWEKSMTYPEQLKAELQQALPDVAKGLRGALLDGVTTSESYLDKLIVSLEHKETLDLYLMQRQDWDVFVTVYPHTDVLQHHFWQIIDETHPWYNVKDADKFRPKVEQFARRLDTAVYRLVEASDGGTVMIMSDHGFGPAKRVVYVNALLDSLGYLRLKPEHQRTKRLTPNTIKKWVAKLDVFGLRRLIGKRLRQRIRAVLRETLTPELDRAHTLAFFELNNDQGVWINRRTKLNPDGPEMSSEEYDQLCERLVSDLRQAVDPTTGDRLFDLASRRENVFSGPYVEFAPDVLLQPAYGYVTSSDFSISTTGAQPRGLVSGYHRPEGILVVWGANVEPGELPAAQIKDVAPTLLYLAGAPVPQGLDGHILDVVTPVYRESHPVDYFDASTLALGGQVDGTVYTDEDEKAVIDRLRDLGYV